MCKAFTAFGYPCIPTHHSLLVSAYFYGVFSSNHPEIALPYFDLFFEYWRGDGELDAEMPDRGDLKPDTRLTPVLQDGTAVHLALTDTAFMYPL